MKCLKVLKRHLIKPSGNLHPNLSTSSFQLLFSRFFLLIGKRQHQKFNKSCSRRLSTADTPLKINTEHSNEGLGSMIFLCTWVSLRFQPIIFQRVTLISSSAEVSTVTMWTGNLHLNLLWRPHRLNHLDFFGAILNPKNPKAKISKTYLSCNIGKIVFVDHDSRCKALFVPIAALYFCTVSSKSNLKASYRIAFPGDAFGKDGCLSWFLFKTSTSDTLRNSCENNSDVVQLEVFSFYEYIQFK